MIWIGKLISFLDNRLNRATDTDAVRRIWGVAALIVIVFVPATIALAIERLFGLLPLGMLLTAIAASSLVAQRSLGSHVKAVADALDSGGIVAGRKAVSQIVGRDPERLDEAGVSRAAIESLAENFSDGITAPAFWLAIGGFAGGAAYKAANTADSMIGHRTKRHEAFGWAAARFDDLINLPASRLTALAIVLAAFLAPGADPKAAWDAAWRDANKHRSPNAGWPEAAMAGALGLRLAGPRVYGETRVEDHWMGDGRAEANAADIRRALLLYKRSCGLLWALATLLAAAILL